MHIQPRFTFNEVRFDQDNNLHLVLGLTAPKSDWQAQRPPLCVIPVLDISGSMKGDKLLYAKRSILKLVDHLSQTDYCGFITFSSLARVDFAPVLMSQANKDHLKKVVGGIGVEGSTNFSGGMLLALETANKMDLPQGTLIRVIMFTDGHPTHGVTDPEGLVKLLSKQAGCATLSAFGYGLDANQELLGQISDTGKGNYAFVKDPDGALSAFGKELGGLLSTYAQYVNIELTPHNGHSIKEVLSDVEVKEEVDGAVKIDIPSILSEETVNLVFAMKVAKQKAPGPRQVTAMDVKVSYEIIDADGKSVAKTIETKAKIQFVKPGDEQKTPTKEVDEIVARAQLVKAQVEAEKLAKSGQYGTAGGVLKGIHENLVNRGHVGLAGLSEHLGGMYASSGAYTSTTGNRVALRAVMRGGAMKASSVAKEDEAVLLAANYAMSNSTQASLVEAFENAGQGVTPEAPEAPEAVPVRNHIAGIWNLSAVKETPQDPAQAQPENLTVEPQLNLSKHRSERW